MNDIYVIKTATGKFISVDELSGGYPSEVNLILDAFQFSLGRAIDYKSIMKENSWIICKLIIEEDNIRWEEVNLNIEKGNSTLFFNNWENDVEKHTINLLDTINNLLFSCDDGRISVSINDIEIFKSVTDGNDYQIEIKRN
jgi:hypothetical protein